MLCCHGLYVQGLGRYLPARVELDARLAGYPLAEVERARSTGVTHLTEERELFPAAMAVHAAREALERAQATAEELALLAVTAIHRHGHRYYWSMASYLQQTLGAQAALPFNLQQGCNANLLALQLAGGYLHEHDRAERALIVASDRFGTSSFDRIANDYGLLYGDAATALVLGKTRGALRIAGLVTQSEPSAEAMHRELHERSEPVTNPYDIRDTKRRFLAEHGRETLARMTQRALLRIKQQLLPGNAERELDHIVFPNMGRELLEANYYPAFHEAARKSLWDFARTVGHLGTADAVAGLYELCVARQLLAGRKILVLGAGAGFTFTGMLITT